MSRKSSFIALFTACLGLPSSFARGSEAAQDAPRPSADETAIRRVVQTYVNAREGRDPQTIAALFTADADQLVSDGVWRRGREELVRGMLESSRRSPGRRTIVVETVRLLCPDLALVDGRYTLLATDKTNGRDMRTTLVLKRGPEGWRIAAIRNMLPAPSATK